MEAKDAEQARLLEELRQRKAPEPAPAQPQTTKPVKRQHRDMGVLVFPQEKEAAEQEPLYTLAPGDTKICVHSRSKQELRC